MLPLSARSVFGLGEEVGTPVSPPKKERRLGHHERLVIMVNSDVYHTLPPVITFGALKTCITRCVTTRGCDTQCTPVMKWVTILGFDEPYQRGGIV